MKATILALAMAAGCATTPSADHERATMEYKRIDAQLRATEQYRELDKACRARGGIVYFKRHGSPRFPLRQGDMAGASCGQPPGR